MPLPKAQLQILGFLLEQGDKGATATQFRQRFGMKNNETMAWLSYLRKRGYIEAVGEKGAYRYRVTEQCQMRIASSLEQGAGDKKRLKWLGLAALLLILSDDK